MRKLYVYTRSDKVSDLIEKMLTNYWYDLTQKFEESKDDIYTSNIYALRGAQDIFDEIYIDDIIIWPNEKQTVTNKELRKGHNLCNIFGCYTAYNSDVEWDGKPWHEMINRDKDKEGVIICN